MNVTLRLYKRHDLDLIPVVMSSSFRLTKQIKGAIRAYLNDESFRIPIESVAHVDSSKNVYLLHFCINREKEPDLFAFVTNLKSGKRNSALKNLLRYYLDTMYLGEYMDDKRLLHYPSNIPQAIDPQKEEEAKEIPIPIRKTQKPIAVVKEEKPKKAPIAKENARSSKSDTTLIKEVKTAEADIEAESEQTEDAFDFMDAMENLLNSARQ